VRARAVLTAAAAAASLVVAVAGAGASLHASAAPLPPLGKRCFAPEAEAKVLRFRASDGQVLDGAVLGHGSVGVLLVHEYRADLCQWLPYARELAGQGFLVLLLDMRCFGLSSCPRANVVKQGRIDRDVAAGAAKLRALGAERVALVGASIGATATLVGASSMSPPPDAVVSLSAPMRGFGAWRALDARAALPRLKAPVLFLAARGDPYVPPSQAKKLYAAAGSAEKILKIVSGSAHGAALVQGSDELGALVLDFIRSHTGS